LQNSGTIASQALLQKISMQPLNSFLHQYGNSVVFGSALLEESGLPLPATPVFVAAGMAAGAGEMNLAAILGLAISGFLLGDILWYFLGLWRGRRVLEWLCRISLEPDSCVRHTEERFLRYRESALVFAKFVPGIHTVIRPLAAISGISLPKFVFFDGIGVIAYVGAFTGLGYFFSGRSDELERWMATAHHGLARGLLVLLAGFILYRFVRRRQFLKNLDTSRLSPDDLKGKLESGNPVAIVDLRSPLERKAFPYALPCARPMSMEELKATYSAFARGMEIVLYCNCPGEAGSAQAALFLQKHGYHARPLANGLDGWKDKQYPLESLEKAVTSSQKSASSRGRAGDAPRGEAAFPH
jgi:membrane protein DedA with SNARE-associated domain/rhodanese-related sulfurtransferase